MPQVFKTRYFVTQKQSRGGIEPSRLQAKSPHFAEPPLKKILILALPILLQKYFFFLEWWAHKTASSYTMNDLFRWVGAHIFNYFICGLAEWKRRLGGICRGESAESAEATRRNIQRRLGEINGGGLALFEATWRYMRRLGAICGGLVYYLRRLGLLRFVLIFLWMKIDVAWSLFELDSHF